MEKTQVVVVGGGPGGYAAAFMAADVGLDVTLVDREANPGGVCLYRGCIPSKALLHAAKVLTEARQATNFGIDFAPPKIDLDRLRKWKDSIVTRLTAGLGQLRNARSVKSVRGTARLLDPHTLEVAGHGKIEFEHAILATGSRPVIPPPLRLDSDRVMDSTGALALEDVPSRLLVVGGGYIGLELGTVYAALGSRVTVVEMLGGILTGADPDLVKVLHKRITSLFDKVLLNRQVVGMESSEHGVRVHTQAAGGGEPSTDEFDRVLVSVGRRPNSEELGLENTAVKVDGRGFICVDGQCRTAEPSIFAIGDVSGEPMLAHRASHQGRLVAEVINGSRDHFNPQAIPAVVFTDPELAWCGLSEEQARQSGVEVDVAKFPWAASGRALTLDRPEGLTKLTLEKKTGRVLGVGIVGSGAGELIAEGALAVEMAALAQDLGMTIHPHPTLSETTMESADVFFGTSTHMARSRR